MKKTSSRIAVPNVTCGSDRGRAAAPRNPSTAARYLIISRDVAIQTRICDSPTAPMPMTLPVSSTSGRTLDTTISATRLCFSSITPRSTFCPYIRMVR
jgi:hypothetical protein